MRQKDIMLVAEIKNRLPQSVLGHVKKIIVFGSRVRDDATEDSDLDVLALVEEKNSEIEGQIGDIAYQVMWDNDFKPIISLKVLAEGRYLQALDKGYTFYRCIEREGVLI